MDGFQDSSAVGPDIGIKYWVVPIGSKQMVDENAFKELMEHVSTPSVPLADVQRQRFTEVAEALKDAEVQAYIEANFSIQLLKLLQAVIPMIAGLL